MDLDDTLPLPPPARPEGETLPIASPSADTVAGRPVRPGDDTLAAQAEPPEPRTTVVPGPRHALGAVCLDPIEDPPELSAYSVRRLLGRGGTGSVFEAVEAATGAVVALKVLHSTLATVPEARERFLREARAATKLDHPNIVRVREAGEENDVHFIAFDRVAGRPLLKLVESSQIPAERAARWARDLADALVHAHSRGVLHRDVKPGNVFVTADWQVLLLDFGLARPADASRLTGTNDILGTPGYMAPEQIFGRPCDERTDVYGLGGTLYAMLEGRSPYPNFNLLLHRDELGRGARPRMPDSTPAGLAAIALTCLEGEPSARYASAEALRDDLDRFLRGDRTRAERRRSGARRRRWALLGALGLSVVVAGALLARWIRKDEVSTPPIVSRDALDPVVDLRGSGEARLYEIGGRATADLGTPRWSGALPARVRLPKGSWLLDAASRVTFVTPSEAAVEMPQSRAPEGYVVVAVQGHRPFLIARTEATVGEYYAFLATLGPDEARVRQARNHKGSPLWRRREVTDDMPVRGISWDDAREFASWKGARLPSMDEWTLACEGADGRPYPWGKGVRRERQAGTSATSAPQFEAVGTAAWNEAPCGALDMFGNAAEWVEDGEGEGVKYVRGWIWTGDPERWCEYDMLAIPKGGPGVQTGVRFAKDLE